MYYLGTINVFMILSSKNLPLVLNTQLGSYFSKPQTVFCGMYLASTLLTLLPICRGQHFLAPDRLC